METELQVLRYRVQQLEREVRLLRNVASRGRIASAGYLDRYATMAPPPVSRGGSPPDGLESSTQ